MTLIMDAGDMDLSLLLFYFLQTVHSKQANRALKRKELLKRKKREEWKRKRATTHKFAFALPRQVVGQLCNKKA